MKKAFGSLSGFVFILLGGYILATYWSYIFSHTVVGVISDVQRVIPPTLIMSGGAAGNQATSAEMFSFAVAIRQKDGIIATASSEDRQWSVAKPGQCAEAKFYPYPPWQFEKAGTYFGARLVKLYVCEEGKLVIPPAGETMPTPAPATPEPPPKMSEEYPQAPTETK